jgi:hypothetical protein
MSKKTTYRDARLQELEKLIELGWGEIKPQSLIPADAIEKGLRYTGPRPEVKYTDSELWLLATAGHVPSPRQIGVLNLNQGPKVKTAVEASV